jgi:biotin operon repressor
MSGERRRRRAEGTGERMPTQLEVVRQVMLLAAQYDSWMTLEELARKTKFAETSISAQLRHLRKQEHGAFQVEKRRRAWEEALRTNVREKVWEYQVRG